jgi:polyisoprenoid-binding protein YceI
MSNCCQLTHRLVLVISLLIHTSWIQAADWEVIKPDSRVGFTAKWETIPFDGQFNRYQTNIHFDPSSPGTGQFAATIFTASADTQDKERDEALRFPEWFNPASYPVAKFTSTSIRSLGAEKFEVTGKLTIKNITRTVSIPFTWKQDQGSARFLGKITLDRTTFNIGEGDWAEDQSIHFDVLVQIDLQLRRL